MHTLAHIVFTLILVLVVLGGFALFWIARQDDSRAGQLIGLAVTAIGVLAIALLTTGHRLF